MELIRFEEQNIVIAENQSEYLPLPAYIDENGEVTCCWKLSFKERIIVLFTGKIWHKILTFNNPLQPQLLLAESPFNVQSPN